MKHLNLMILCDDADSARIAQDAGIDRIFYDLEYIGKSDRQHGRNTVLSSNNVEDLPKLRAVVNKSQLLVRTNPIHAYSQVEIDKAVEYGADILMLPMTIDHHDAEDFVRMVNGRAKVCIMIETASAMARLDNILAVKGVDEIFVGLNDLHISMGLTFMFELLSGGLVEYIADKCKKAGMPFGFGGIARIGEGDLPSDNILGEHVRLGSSSVILSRTFKGVSGVDANAHQINLADEVKKVRERMEEIADWSNEDYANNVQKVKESTAFVVAKIQSKKK